MKLSFGRIRRLDAAFIYGFLALTVTAVLSVLGEEQDSNSPGKLTTGEPDTADS